MRRALPTLALLAAALLALAGDAAALQATEPGAAPAPAAAQPAGQAASPTAPAAPATTPAAGQPGQPAPQAESLPPPAPPPIDFATGVADYREGHYPQALAIFSALALAEPDAGRAAVLHANAGTAAARADLLGEAVWHLRTARALDPGDAVTRTNLERVRVLLGESGSDASRFTATVRELPLRLTLQESQTACAFAAGLALILLALWRARKLGGAGLVAALVLLAGGGLWLWVSNGAWHRLAKEAVVIDTTVNGRAEPDALSEILFRLPSGSVVTAEERRRDWRLVESEAGARGWMPAEQVRPLAVR